jgi:hypothetical protein
MIDLFSGGMESMSFCQSRTVTPAFLAAARANAQKSTGPRTEQGKRYIVLNSLKHGRYSKFFRENLIKAHEDVELYDHILERIKDHLNSQNSQENLRAEMLAREVWCAYRNARRIKRVTTNRKRESESSARSDNLSFAICITNPLTGHALTFTLDHPEGKKSRRSKKAEKVKAIS